MENGRRPLLARPETYLLPSAAHKALTQVRDHIRFLAQLTEPQGESGPDVVYLSAEALAHCFDRLADDLDRIVQTVAPSAFLDRESRMAD